MRIAVIQFPGSNADWDALHAARDVLGADAYYVFHKETDLQSADAVIVPGGFSYGDYLRPGAIAGYSPIAESLRAFGGPVLGICNGFQILTELGMLPGALTRNAHLRFECRFVHLRVEGNGCFTDGLAGKVLRVPIAHADGRYQCDDETLRKLEGEERVAFRYCDASGQVGEAADGLGINPNGSRADIAGIYDASRRILGMMPHPERAAEEALGSADGFLLFDALRRHLEGQS
ncbi:MAG: phosphoribosylformylglycinamidine synthase subunit PurQ [Myxococcota bacterium]